MAGHKCETCDREFTTALGLWNHKQSHKKNIQEQVKQVDVQSQRVADLEKSLAAAEEALKAASIGADKAKNEGQPAKHVPDALPYTSMPKPLVEYLEQNYGNWLNFLEIGYIPWKEDFGGPGMYIKVPEQFSTEYKKIEYAKWDNATRKLVGSTSHTIPDVRWKPVKDVNDVKKWLDLVKEKIMSDAHRKGLKLPGTNTGVDETKQTYEDYKKSLASRPA